MVKHVLLSVWLLPRRAAISVLWMYQKTLSPDHGPLKGLHPHGYCRHEPTCSEYGKNVLRERGLIIGSLLIIRRLFTCHPWHKLEDKKILKVLSQQ